jgi:sugar phosphate isomerase/epimerase
VLAFSTCWNSGRHTSGADMVREILDLGFDAIELGHGLRAPMVAQLLAAREKLGFTVSSIHCFCPLPPEVLADNPDCYEFTSHRAADRRRAIRLAIQTIDMAERFGAKSVVVHTGRVRTMRATGRLIGLAEKGLLLEKPYARAKLAAVTRREKIGEAYVGRALDCLAQIADHARVMGVAIGIENRQDLEAVPSERELENLLCRLDASNAGYWHDFGHAQIKEHLGLLSHARWLDQIGPRAIGCHVHDVQWAFKDHRAPFTGTVPFEDLLPKLPKTCDGVFEMHPGVARKEILAAREHWLSLFPS